MKLKTFSIKQESFRLGDFNDLDFVRFSTEELRDSYFEKLKENNRQNGCEIITSNDDLSFEANDGKWSYNFSKVTENIVIYEEDLNDIIL